MLPPPSPRHNNAESKKQAQKSVRFLHSYACSGSGHSISPLCTQQIPPGIISAGEGCPGSREREGRIPSPGRARPGQGRLSAAHRARCAPGIQHSVCRRDAVPLGTGPQRPAPLPAVGNRERQLLVIVHGRQQPERRRMHVPVGDIMAQSHLFQNRNLRGFLLFLLVF